LTFTNTSFDAHHHISFSFIFNSGFDYQFYKNIAASHGVSGYEKMTIDQPWPLVELEQFVQLQQQLQVQLQYNASQIQTVRNSLIALLRPNSYTLVTQYLQSLGLENADVLAKVFAREQPLVVNAQQLVSRILKLLWKTTTTTTTTATVVS
jgi:hypothetical protein